VTDYRKNGGGVGGASLPTATAADELLRSTGAGTTYEAVGQGDVVGDVLVAFIGSDPAGTAIISDGAGDVGLTSAAVSALLAAADAAGMRAALYAPLTTPTFASGGWTFTQPAGSTAAIASGVLTCTVNAASASSPDALRTITSEFDPLACDIRVRISAFSGTGTYLRAAMTLYLASGGYFWQPRILGSNEEVSLVNEAGATAGVVVAGILGGQGWMRLVVRGNLGVFYTGIGSGGAEPSTWTQRHAVQRTTNALAGMDTFRVEVQQGDGSGGAVSVSYRDLSVSPL
jgi:hypothetical protein